VLLALAAMASGLVTLAWPMCRLMPTGSSPGRPRSADGVAVTEVTHDAWSVGDQACTFVEFSRGNDCYT
jgi:hypothetical protein